jgi:N-acetylmuramoyl-L-alanine amidase
MKNRNFVLFPVLILIFAISVSSTAHIFNQNQSVIIDNKIGNMPLSQIPSFKKWDIVYISLNDFVQKTGYGIYTNDNKQKSVLYIGNDKATFTANNNYVILNDYMYQMPYTPVWKDGELWVPAVMLVDLYNSFTAHRFNFDNADMILTLGMKNVNLTNVSIESKDNGTLIKINSTKQFKKTDIALKVTNGWLHVEVYGGKVEPATIKNAKTSGIISSIDVIEFDQLVSLAFKLKKSIISKELVFDQNSNDILVNLRTNEKLDSDKITKMELEKQKNEWLIDTIVLDAGHGGHDPGALGNNGLQEKDITLAVTIKLGQLIQKNLPDTKVIFTRQTDVFIPLWERTKIANEHKGKLFISLHCNSNNNKKVNGIETYFLSADMDKNKQAQEVVLKENASIKFEKAEDQKRYEGINFILATMAQSAFIRQSQHFASTIQNSCANLLKPLGLKDRGVKQGRFWVMVGATMPNVLVEMGFISNKSEGTFLKKNATQMKIAQAIFEGIKKYKNDIEAAI